MSRDLSTENILQEFDAGLPITEPDSESSLLIGQPASNSWRKFKLIGHVTSSLSRKDSKFLVSTFHWFVVNNAFIDYVFYEFVYIPQGLKNVSGVN